MNLRVATYNIRHASTNGRYTKEIANLIKNNNIDIIGIQEIDVNTARVGNKNILEEIAKYSDYKYYQFYKTIDYQGGDYGIGILSKYEIILTGSMPLAYRDESRVLGYAKINVNDKLVNFLVTHFDLGTYENIRRTEFLEVKEYIDTQDNFILAGDFNVHDWTDKNNSFFEYEEFFGFYNLVNDENNTLYTFSGKENAGGNILPLDNIILSNNIDIINRAVIETNYSDHDLLYADIKLNF